MVIIPPVRTFQGVAPDKAQALKPLEEAAEVFSAWENFRDDASDVKRSAVVDECADVIQATLNLVAALGVEDFGPYMKSCEKRNRERGRITK